MTISPEAKFGGAHVSLGEPCVTDGPLTASIHVTSRVLGYAATVSHMVPRK